MTSFNEGISHSIGRTGSDPKTSWKGVNPIVVLAEVLYAQGVEKSYKCQFDLYFPTIR